MRELFSDAISARIVDSKLAKKKLMTFAANSNFLAALLLESWKLQQKNTPGGIRWLLQYKQHVLRQTFSYKSSFFLYDGNKNNNNNDNNNRCKPV